eukprot:SAG31_NODE_5893_length_2270_cov_1.878858_3_plen_223_part_00
MAAKRKVYALESLDNLIKNEDLRVKEEKEKKEKEAEKKKEKEEKEEKEGQDATAEPEAEAEAEPEPEPEAEKKEGDDDDKLSKVQKDLKKADESADERIAPPAEKLFELLYDEIEHAPITAIGVDPNNKCFTRGLDLLRTRTNDEMTEAIEKTKLARQFSAGVPLSGAVNTEHKDLHHYADGDKVTIVLAVLRPIHARRGRLSQPANPFASLSLRLTPPRCS